MNAYIGGRRKGESYIFAGKGQRMGNVPAENDRSGRAI